jgi:hypothetical protein|tara:strand:- start:403 stop:813 length:411 start_codon:yes stop_codon:yes gene_type:complete
MIKLKQEDPRYKLDESRKVFVYKNLHKDCWSIKQNGLVKAHTDNVTLYNVVMKVNKKGREKVLREKRKNVHAGISGYLCSKFFSDAWDDISEDELIEITYNPYKYTSFVDKVTKKPRWFACIAKLNKKSVFVEKSA